ncbi:hypothetical protein P775_01710 [Puniceibacterium antarcticum]|uniref:histidine kinase n=1 Tax=Puniceibacterium antarcticum TaxID=1206336 RepID=A0A2G8RKA6_9RHOB|nr:GAF domain-containing sensor histidine kinase [Puniceibacterium antarcticum]PIL21933.1 hypothetical protein P775_01710 [Puniceibacterium antarcticum]
MAAEPHPFQADIDAIGRSPQVPVILETVLLATGMGFAAVARVTDSRWVTCRALDTMAFGLHPGSELEVESTLCHQVRESESEIVIDDAANDEVYRDHHTPARYGLRSYISVPITRADGRFFGTLCAIDPAPRKLSDPRVLSMFRMFAALIGQGLDADEQLRQSEEAVERERHLSEVQERFIAILAHDLRNPVSVLNAGFRMLDRTGLSEKGQNIATLMRGSVQRMSDLIENLLYAARSRQGGGIEIVPQLTGDLAVTLQEIIAELDAVSPEVEILADIDLPEQVRCDRARLAQMVSNLLGNAVTHGAQGEEIRVTARVRDGALVIAVANRGEPIPPEMIATLFQPFEQLSDRPRGRGLGLGLYISSEIAKGHGGVLDVTASEGWTVFTFSMPDAV